MLTRRTFLLSLPWLPAAAAASESSLGLLLGRWRFAERRADGTPATGEFELRMNGHFSGSLQLGSQPEWRFNGDWTLRERQLIWVYTGSSVPLAPDLREDIDEIVTVDAERLVLRSRRNGEVRTFTRAP
jgi:hypothetical protein